MVPRRWDELPVEGLEDPTRVLAQRMRIALLAWLAPIFLFGLADLFLAHRGALAQLYALKLFGLIAVGIAYAALRATRQWRTVLAIALLSIALIYALSTASAIIDGEDRTIPILSLAGALATATLLPWGVGPQLAVVALAALSPIVTSEFISGSAWNVLSYPNVGMAIGLIVSVWVAGEFERSRRALAEHNREQQRAEAAVRRLNEELEGRVVERTAELEQANSAMHEQIAVRVEAEAELQRSRAALSALIDNTDDAIWSIDRSYRVTAFNTVASRRFSAVFGEPLFEGCLGDEFMPAQAHTQWRARYDRGLAGERFSVEHAYEAPTGTHHFTSPSIRSSATGWSPAWRSSAPRSPSASAPRNRRANTRPSSRTCIASAPWAKWRRGWRTRSTSRWRRSSTTHRAAADGCAAMPMRSAQSCR
jgi:PAS domain-containing protein